MLPRAARAEYARLLLARFEETGDPADLIHAESLARRVVAQCPPDDPARAGYLSNLALMLRSRFRVEGDPQLLDSCLQVHEAAIDAAAHDDPDRPALMINFAVSLRVRFTRTGGRADLDRAVALTRAAAPAVGGHPQRAALRAAIVSVLRTAAEHSSAPGDLAEAIDLVTAELDVTEDAAQQRRLRLTGSALLRLRFIRNGDPEDLDRCVALAGAAADLPLTHPDGPSVHSTFGAALFLRYQHCGAPEDLHRAALVLTAALDAMPVHHTGTSAIATNLAAVLHARYDATADPADLSSMITVGELAVQTAPPGGATRVAAAANLASAYLSRWQRTGSTDDLDAAVTLRRDAIAAGPGPEQLAALLSGLATTLLDRYQRVGDPDDIDAAITAGQRAVNATTDRSPERGRFLANLCAAYRARYDRAGDVADLAEALRAGRASVQATSPDDPGLPRRRSALGLVLLRSATRTGDAGDLDEAVELGRLALTATPAGSRLRPRMLVNAANALRVRYERTGDLADLDEAVLDARAAVAATPSDDALRPRRLAMLATSVLRRFESLRQRADIDEAVHTAAAAIDATPADHPHRSMYAANLGLMVFRRFEAFDVRADLDSAIDADRHAVVASAADHPDRLGYLSNLVAPLLRRYALDGDDADLADAVAAARAAVSADGGAPDNGGFQFNLAMALRARFVSVAGTSSTDPAGDLAAAAEAFQRCSRSPTTMPVIRAAAAAYRAELVAPMSPAATAEDWIPAGAAYAEALDLLPMLAGRSLGWDSRHAQLARLAGLGSDAAAVALHAGDRLRAVAVLEQARGILLGQAADQRRDIGALRLVDPRLAEEFEEIRDVINADTTPTSELDASPGVVAASATRRRAAAARFDDVMARVRALGLLRDPEPEDLLAAAAGGPVIVVNVSRYRCDGLIIRTTGVEVVPLPTLRHEDVTANAQMFLTATAANDWDSNATILRILGWLWDDVVAPVLASLTDAEAGRLWWLPTGALGVLPLHAAGRAELSLLDVSVSSYTSTLRALIRARGSTEAAVPAGTAPDLASSPLVVAVPDAGARPTLRRAADECQAAAGHLHATAIRTGAGAACGEVLDRLRDADWAHFACHALTDLSDPAASALILDDGPLRVRDIGILPSGDRRLAYLSACTTALTGGLLVDEAMHISSMFQLIGFRHVVGTLWRVDDDIAYDLAAATYRRLADGLEPAAAVNAAVRAQYHRYPANPMLWGAFVHLGP
ncbi:CHAT domain-containing protein [Dactylosporangium sp. NBC_01737]|uniref:CHAT domain-containing protein n=1 Tax=Dactylosporangium sp. NBC_01737 TaxID=2975959 RepID=UPI002E0E1042|nr:CHAT domain-containing protein [Dactylosporangium sp. NBC_01737]